MEIKILETKTLHTLNAYKQVDLCIIDGLEYPIFLRQKTLDRFVADEIFGRGCYDTSMVNSRHYDDYKEWLDVREPRFILDAGGNIGLAAIYYAVQFPQAQIVTIEPDDDNYFLLCKNIKPYKNITAIKGALWDKKETLFIANREDAVWDDGTLNAGKYMVGSSGAEREKGVESFTIDEIIEKYDMDKIDILKMDIEGAEREIFSGEYDKWLPKVKLFVLEHHDFYKPGATKAVFRAISDYDFHFLYDNSDSLETMMFVFDKH